MNFTENADEIVIRYVPVKSWILGGILTLLSGGFFLWLFYYIFVAPPDLGLSFVSSWLRTLIIIIFVTAVVWSINSRFSFISMTLAPLVNITVNRKAQSVDVRFQKFYNSNTDRFRFHQVEKFKSYKSIENFSSKYFLALILINQKEIKLKIPISGDKQATIKLVKKLNKFVKQKESAK